MRGLRKIAIVKSFFLLLISLNAAAQGPGCAEVEGRMSTPWFEYLFYTGTKIRTKYLPQQFNANITSENRIQSITLYEKNTQPSSKVRPVRRYVYGAPGILSSIEHFDSTGKAYIKDSLVYNRFNSPIKWNRYLHDVLCFSDTISYDSSHRVSKVEKQASGSKTLSVFYRYKPDTIEIKVVQDKGYVQYQQVKTTGLGELVRVSNYDPASRFESQKFFKQEDGLTRVFYFEVSGKQISDLQRNERYNNDGLLVSASETSSDRLLRKEKYYYSGKGLLIKVEVYDGKNRLSHTTEYKYQFH